MQTTALDFMKYCGIFVATLGLTAVDLLRLGEALRNPYGPSILRPQGSACTGCSMSLLLPTEEGAWSRPADYEV